MNLSTLLPDSIAAARAAGRLIQQHIGSDIDYKGSLDLVTEADRASERLLVKQLKALLPSAGILAEESAREELDAEYLWVIDPLDGTTNFAHGYPAYSVSIALTANMRPVLGVVFDPNRQECFSAVQGEGAFLNGEPIHVSRTGQMHHALLATGFPYDVHTHPRNNLIQFEVMIKQARGIRRGGSAALDLAYVAAGRFDGYWEEKLGPWDLAAGWLLVLEAGGVAQGYAGEVNLEQGHIVAGNPKIQPVIRQEIQRIENSGVLPPVSSRPC